MKKIFLALSIVAVSFAANAQSNEGFHVAGGLHVALPLGDFGKASSFGVGAQVQGEYVFAENISGTFTTGYTSFMGKSVDEPTGYDINTGQYTYSKVKLPATGYIPFLAGIRFYAAPSFFIGGKLGYGLLSGGGESDGAFNYQPEIGYNAEKFQVAAGYNGLSKNGASLSHIGLSVLYKFN